jgi:pimeloyl-ACP methyl ester carboxylesterase
MKKQTVNNLTFAYEDRGAGQPVVLLHGYPLNHRMWAAQIGALSPHCRVIAPDLRGFGESTLGESDADRGVSMPEYAADVAALLDAIDVREPAILCGLSMGGYIMWQFLRQFPDRVKAFVPCDTRAIADSDEARAGRLKTASEVREKGVEPIIEAMLPKLLGEQTRQSRPNVVAELTAIMRSSRPEAIAAALRGMAARPDVTPDLSKFTQPALLIVGADDAISPPDEMRGIAEKLPNAKFVEIPNSGHMTTMENSAAVNAALVEFVRSLT